MNRRTFDILAQWVAKEANVKIEFHSGGPCADVKHNIIKMPFDIKESNVFSVLAWLMHEAGHIRQSHFPDHVAKGPIAHDILNVAEDISIDNKNFTLLPNIRSFYERMVDDHVKPKEADLKKAPLFHRALVNVIQSETGFGTFNDPEALKAIRDNMLTEDIRAIQEATKKKDWNKINDLIQGIMNKFKIKEPPEVKVSVKDWDGNPGDGDEGKEAGEASGKERNGLGLEKFIHPSSLWGKGTLKGNSSAVVGQAALKDLTKESFKELISIKETHIIHDGITLDTDNLTDFFAGDVENLFKDEDIKKRRKSKIVFLLDASGSMSSELLDGQNRRTVLIKCIKSVIEILDEVRATEGFEVNYEVNAFTDSLHKLNQENWEKGYRDLDGGTNILNTFSEVQKNLIKDQEIDGKKLVVVVTDGEVSNNEIEQVRKEIIRHNADVRCMFVGVGADLMGAYNKSILGDQNILMEQMADQVILDVICAML